MNSESNLELREGDKGRAPTAEETPQKRSLASAKKGEKGGAGYYPVDEWCSERKGCCASVKMVGCWRECGCEEKKVQAANRIAEGDGGR